MATVTHHANTERVVSRVNPASKTLLEQAAALAGYSSVNQFIVQAALREAERIVEREQRIMLSAEDTRQFLQALENPPEPNQKLKQAAQLYQKTVVSE